MLYLRPGNLEKDFIVKRKQTGISDTGTPFSRYVETGLMISGVLADAEKGLGSQKKHLWDQDQHTLTHTIVSQGEPVAKEGDVLAMDERYFLILLTDDTGSLGIATVYYAEERRDLK